MSFHVKVARGPLWYSSASLLYSTPSETSTRFTGESEVSVSKTFCMIIVYWTVECCTAKAECRGLVRHPGNTMHHSALRNRGGWQTPHTYIIVTAYTIFPS